MKNGKRTNKGTNATSMKISNRPTRNEMHFEIQKSTRATVTKNKKKIIHRKQKNSRIEY